ncbi:MAG TPA: hypothetical protein VFL12_00300 [Thermoanaerobaculia bacterium]|nr:hypothetical protein [Thermoanaerobaculia bacterium]
MKKIAAFVFVLLAAALGCRRREVVTADGSKVVVERDGNKVTVSTPDGVMAAAGASSALPEGFPKDIPLYPGASVVAALDAGGAGGHHATFETKDWPDDVAKFYTGRLAGWKSVMDMKTEDSHTLILNSPDGRRSLTVAAKREALNTVVGLSVSEK